MKRINEHLANIKPLSEFVKANSVNEGILGDLMGKLKGLYAKVVNVFGRVWTKLKNSSYWMDMAEDGTIRLAITPGTAGQAYVDGFINKANTVVVSSKDVQKITGNSTQPKAALKLYGGGNSIHYWQRGLKESVEGNREAMENYFNGFTEVNEVKMHTDDPLAKYNIRDNDGLKRDIALSLKSSKLKPLLIFGAPGIGKTAILMSVLDTFPGGKDYQLIVKTLSNETPDNFTLPKYTEDGDKATDVPKTWLPVYRPTGDKVKDAEADAACGKGLLFIDELSRATPQVLNVCLPLINERQFNGYKVGSGWTIVCASNRMEDETSGQSAIGNALMNRFRVVYYEPTVNSWRQWAQTQNYMSPLLLQWLSMPESEDMSGGKYFYYDPNEAGDFDNPAALMCTPRSWTDAMVTLSEFAETGSMEGFKIFDVPREILTAALSEHIPSDAIDGFLAFLDTISKIGDFDAAVEGVWKSGRMPRISPKDLGKVALPFSQLIITAHSEKLPTQKEMENWANAITSSGSEQMASYSIDIFQNVFCRKTGLPKEIWGDIFYIHAKAETYQEEDSYTYESWWKPNMEKFAAAWGTTYDKLPNYENAFDTLTDKFGDAFTSLFIGGKPALG